MTHKILLIFFWIELLSTLAFGQFSSQNVLSADVAAMQDGVMADFDADGDPDLVVSIHAKDALFYYENVEGVFVFGAIITADLDAADALTISDMNGDGNTDIIAASNDEFVWFLNNGDGTFGEAVIIDGDVGPVNYLFAADVDGDGDNDILTSELYQLYYYENLGGGDFAAKVAFFDEPESSRSVCATDLDGDGDLDVIGTTQSDEVSYYENLGEDGFADFELLHTVSTVRRLVMADLDNDDDDDLLIVSSGKVEWCENLGSELAEPALISDLVSGAVEVAVIDSDLDGDLDIFINSSTDDGKIVWLENAGLGTFETLTDVSTETPSTNFLTMGDINGDGYPGIVTNTEEFFEYDIVTLENTAGIFSDPYSAVPITPYLQQVAVGDINNDGIDDIVVASSLNDFFAWFLGNESGGFGPVNTFTNSMSAITALAVADLNGDGLNDIVYADSDLMWCEALGDGEFASAAEAHWGYGLSQKIITRDFDADGDIDLIVCNSDFESLVIHLNNGDGLMTETTFISEEALNARDFILVDINADGLEDAVTTSMTFDKIVWFENLGDGTFGEENIVNDGYLNPWSLSAGDFDEDGTVDIVAMNSSAELSWFPNDGTGVFGTAESIVDESYTGRQVYAVDVDNDYDSDIIVSYSGVLFENKIVWYENLGEGEFSAEQDISGDLTDFVRWSQADFSEDGDLDIAVIGSEEGIVSWYENFGNFNTQIKGELYLDLNEDGVRDPLEEGALFLQVLSTPEHTFSHTYGDGRYFMNFDPEIEETYTIEPEELDYWRITSDPLDYAITVDGDFTGQDSVDFGIYPDTLVDRVRADLTGGFPRCNSLVNYWLNIQNTGSTVPSGIIHLKLDDSISYVSSEIVPDSIVAQNLYWSYDSLGYFASENFYVLVEMPDFMSMGDTLTSILTETVDSLGESVFTTADTLEQILVCAYDPNDKIATPAGIDSLGYIPVSTQDLEYTIRFQNTGTDTALTVVIKDQLDTNLNWSSFTPISSSHDMVVDIDYSGQVLFTFEDIMLPDSNVNELESQGFVKFQIDLVEGLALGTQIHNTARIYFDSNPAIVTNTKINTLYDCSDILESLVFESIICNGDSLHAEVDRRPSTAEIIWTADEAVIGTEANLLYAPEEAEELSITLTVSTDFCTSDSVFNVTFLPEIPVNILDSVFICAGDSLEIFDTYRSEPGWYTDSLLSVDGCDSLVSIFSELAMPYSNSETFTICASDSIFLFGEYRTEAGVYENILTTVHGCDSTVTAHLEVNPVYHETNAPINICEGDSILIFGSYQSETGIYYDSLTTVFGCDSIHSQSLTVYPTYLEIAESEYICFGDSALIFDNYQTIEGSYVDSLMTITGCDSLILKELIVYELPVVEFMELSDEALCVNSGTIALEGSPEGGTFEGAGVTGSVFDPELADLGNHTLIYSFEDDNGCSGQDSVQVLIVDCLNLYEYEGNSITIHPIPFHDFTQLNFGKGLSQPYTVVIYDLVGKIVREQGNISGETLKIYREGMASGTYILSIYDVNSKNIYSTKLLVE